jgi:hypothetical protein
VKALANKAFGGKLVDTYSGFSGFSASRLFAIPKLDVAGSNPVARSGQNTSPNAFYAYLPRAPRANPPTKASCVINTKTIIGSIGCVVWQSSRSQLP